VGKVDALKIDVEGFWGSRSHRLLRGRRTRQRPARDPRALSPQLLRRLRARSRRPQHRGDLPQAGV